MNGCFMLGPKASEALYEEQFDTMNALVGIVQHGGSLRDRRRARNKRKALRRARRNGGRR
jgi:hypothetical protein